MPTNDWAPFATGAGANVITPAAFNPTPVRQTGFQSGVAQSALVNTVLRQSQFVAAMITQFVSDTLGQSVVDNGSLSTLEGQFIAAIQQSVGGVPQAGLWHFGRDVGTADHLNIPAQPIITAYADGMIVSTIVNNTNLTTVPNMAANGLAATLIVNSDGTSVTPATLQAGNLAAFLYDGTAAHWRIVGNIGIPQTSLLHRTVDNGTANALNCQTVIPPVIAVTDGMEFLIKKGPLPNTGPMTLNVSNLVTAPLTWPDGTALSDGQWPGNADADVMFDSSAGGSYRLLSNPTYPSPQKFLLAPRTYFVNASTGNDNNDGLTLGTPFLTVQKAINQSAKFNLNNFNITINVANGTYVTGTPINLLPINGSGTIFLVGNPSSPASVILSCSSGSAILGNSVSGYDIQGFMLTSTGVRASDPSSCLWISTGVSLSVHDCIFGPCFSAWINTGQSCVLLLWGNITFTGPVTVNGGSRNGISLGALTQVINPGALTPTITFSNAVTLNFFFVLSGKSLFQVTYAALVGAGNVTGPRYYISDSSINTNGGGAAAYWPIGTLTGTFILNGGQIY
jgi:hypothetical protein